MIEINEIVKFALPCWLINMSLNSLYVIQLVWPNFINYNLPLDGKRSWTDKRRILGNSTTIIGIPVALLIGAVIGWQLEYPIWLSALIGILVYTGHALGSFIKRRNAYADGEFMPFVDHADYIITAGVVLGLIGKFSWLTIIIGILATYIIHPIITYLAYKLKLHKQPL